jgi:hypothetical protein
LNKNYPLKDILVKKIQNTKMGKKKTSVTMGKKKTSVTMGWI